MAEQGSDERQWRAALLVMHGIGEQNPYQTLDAFTRGLANRLDLGAEQMQHRLVWRDGRAVSMIRMNLPDPLGHSAVKTIDLYEFYWAGMVQGRIKIRQVLGWIARTSLTPLRYWAQQPPDLFREKGATAKRLWVFVRELFRAALLTAVAALILLPFVYAAGNAAKVSEAAKGVWATVSSVEHPVVLFSWLALIFFAVMIFRGWVQLLLQRIRYRTNLSRQVSMERSASLWWLGASVIAFGALSLAAWLVHSRYQLAALELLGDLWAAIRPWPVLAPILAVVVAFFLRIPLIKFLGDVVLYVTADAKSSFFRTRGEILQRSTEALRTLLTDPAYEAVYVAGHSLGSVIAYDTINHIVREVRAESGPDDKLSKDELDRLKGLLTFGSPLDKIYYFFRTHVRDEEAIRAQLLSSLHGFRKRGSERSYGDLRLARYEIPEPADFCWYNVYSRFDRVSGYLDFYEVHRQVHRPYLNPVMAHMAYWNDPRFYDAVLEWLEGRCRSTSDMSVDD